MKYLKILLLAVIVTLATLQHANAISKYNLMTRWYGSQGPPSEGLLLYAESTTDTIGLSSLLVDKSGNGYDVPVYGYTVGWNGTAYSILHNSISNIGNFKLEFEINTTDTTFYLFSGGASILRYLTNSWSMKMSDDATKYFDTSVPASGAATLERVGDTVTLTVAGVSDSVTVTSATTFDIDRIVSGSFTGTLTNVKRYNSSSTLSNHWPIEGSGDISKSQITISDIVGGNDSTIIYPPDPLYVVSSFGSNFSANGGRVVYVNEDEAVDLASNSGVPVGYNNSLSVTGVDSLTATKDTSNAGVYVNIPTTLGAIYYFVVSSMSYVADVDVDIMDEYDGVGSIINSDSLDISGVDNSILAFEFTATSATTSILFDSVGSYALSNISVKTVLDGVASYSGLESIPYSYTGKVVCIGDSLTNLNYPLVMGEINKNATIIDAGVSGNTIASMEARFAADVVAESPEYVYYFGAANSIIADVSLASMQTDILSMISMASAANIKFIIGTPTPFGDNVNWTSGRQTILEQLRDWILALTNVYAKVDLYTPLNDTGTDNLLAAYDSGDGLHLNTLGDIVVTTSFDSANSLADSVFLTFSGVLDAPPNIFVLNFPEESALIDADTTELLFTSGSANDVDPYDIPLNTGDKIYKGDKALLIYNPALTEPNITKAENFVD